LCRSGMSGV